MPRNAVTPDSTLPRTNPSLSRTTGCCAISLIRPLRRHVCKIICRTLSLSTVPARKPPAVTWPGTAGQLTVLEQIDIGPNGAGIPARVTSSRYHGPGARPVLARPADQPKASAVACHRLPYLTGLPLLSGG